MHAFDFILVLFSFVYAAAVTHVLSTAGQIIIASKRIRLSWFNTGWMLVALLFTCAWWIGLWDLHVVKSWDIGSIAFYFSIAAGIYLNARLVSPRIPESGEIGCGRLLLSGSFFFTGHRNNPAIEFFFKRVNATVLIKPFNLNAVDSTIRDVLRKLV
jgi:hypothetical protein